MLRIIILALLALSAFAGGLALALFHWFGWKGLIAFPIIVLLGVWLGKMLIGKAIKRFALGLFSMKARVLRGATMQVHSIEAVPKPPEVIAEAATEEETDVEEAAEEAEVEDSGDERAASESDRAEQAEPEEPEQPEEPKEYFAIDLTITPREEGQHVWEPGEFVLATEKISSLEELEAKEVGTTDGVLIWDGSAFVLDEQCKYPGIQRLKLTVATTPGTSKAWLHYYNEPIGCLELPPWTPAAAKAKSASI
jgi:hypothetical protein